MVERIVSGLFDNPYETILGICAACCFAMAITSCSEWERRWNWLRR